VQRIQEFLEGNFVAIGWPNIGDLTGQTKEEIYTKLVSQYGYEGIRLKNTTTVVDNFANKLVAGDLLVSPNGGDIYIAEVVGDYTYDLSKDNEEEGYPHQRAVKWLNKDNPLPRTSLPVSLRSSLRGWLTVTRLGDFRADLKTLLSGKPLETVNEEPVLSEYKEACEGELDNEGPLIDENLIRDAEEVLVEELHSDDPFRRLAAAIEILRNFRIG
jgi:predicted Mrr-cat superfamily restriction endonuclease